MLIAVNWGSQPPTAADSCWLLKMSQAETIIQWPTQWLLEKLKREDSWAKVDQWIELDFGDERGFVLRQQQVQSVYSTPLCKVWSDYSTFRGQIVQVSLYLGTVARIYGILQIWDLTQKYFYLGSPLVNLSKWGLKWGPFWQNWTSRRFLNKMIGAKLTSWWRERRRKYFLCLPYVFICWSSSLLPPLFWSPSTKILAAKRHSK